MKAPGVLFRRWRKRSWLPSPYFLQPSAVCCDSCGALTDVADLDAKPSRFYWSLQHAADTGADFDRLECQRCYGPDYEGATVQRVMGWRRYPVAFRAAMRRAIFTLVRWWRV